jgi:hypothetical protein
MMTFNMGFMTLIKSKCGYVLCLLLILVSVGYCQERAAQRLAFKTLFLSSPATEYTYLSDGEILPFPVGVDMLSSEAIYVGSSPLLVFAGQPNLEESLPEQAITTIVLDPGSREATFICISREGLLSCVNIPSDLAIFPPGAFCFINATTDRVVGILGEEKIAIQPGAAFTVKADNFEMRRIPIKMAFMDETDQWRMFYSSKWTLLGQKRSFIIIFRDQRTSKLHARGVNF